ncbi:MAG: protease modulator HflK [Sedimentisphaerales bacterium]|nr:protease modulator HflK [Sedimentisphaerales bacterium]
MFDHSHHHHHHSDDGHVEHGPHVELDPANKSLSDALRISFVILKMIMLVLIVLFLVSGFKTVGSDEQAIVLRFGKIRGVGEGKILKPRALPYWIFPYPIEEIVKIPVEKNIDLGIRSFWYYQTEADLLAESQGRKMRVNRTLDPIADGYCLTGSEQQDGPVAGYEGSDYNIIHSKWQLRYQIKDPEQFFRNVYVRDTIPGEVYFDVMTESITPLLKSLFEDAIVSTMVKFTIDEAIKSKDRIPRDVMSLLQEKLDRMGAGDIGNMCGVEIVSVYLTDITWPRQVDEAFQNALRASQDSQKVITEARTYAQNTLIEVAGPVAEELYAALHAEKSDERTMKLLWSELAGTTQEKIFEARGYRAKVISDAKANADYLLSLLPEYRKHPEIVLQSIYRDAVELIFSNVDEKFIVEPSEDEELRILMNRNPKPKKKTVKSGDTQSTNK